MNDPLPDTVNPHYLQQVVATARTHEVVASEDIVTSGAIKLLAKGARIDDEARDRLLQHKLRRPLEECTEVIGGVVSAQFESIGDALLAKYPLLRALCTTERARSAPASVAGVALTLPMQSLMTVYGQSRPGRLEHAVGVAMLALSLARRLLPGAVDRHRVLAIAGLLHDVGELYIDPVHLQSGVRLDGAGWRHIAIHPLVGHRVLLDMAGAGPQVAEAVLQHHERMDGFGYPHGVGGEAFTVDGEIVAAAEWLMALVENETSPLARASMALRLVPGEFRPELIKVIAGVAKEVPALATEHNVAPPLAEALPRILRLAGSLDRFNASRGWIEERMAESAPALRNVLGVGLNRLRRIQVSFASTGLDASNAQALLGELSAGQDPEVYVEITSLIKELEWRMRELERSQRLRASLLTGAEQSVVEEVIARLNGSSIPAAEALA